MNRTNIPFVSCTLVAVVATLAGPAVAAPTIQSLETASDEGLTNGATVTIGGSGFGQKDQAAPVLFDRQTSAFENGELNDFYSMLKDGERIPIGRDGVDQAIWADSRNDVLMDRGMKRHEASEGAYLLKGDNAFLELPVAYGGPDGWDTPTDERFLYASWRYKVQYDSLFYWRFIPHEVKGKFIENEDLIIDNKRRGKFIANDDGEVNAVLEGENVANNLYGKHIEGEQSGATMRFPDSWEIDGEVQFWRPGTKYMRVWDHRNSEGIRASLSGTDYFLSHHPDRDKSSNKVWDEKNVHSGKWHHFELKLDMKEGTMETWFNGRHGGVAEFDPSAGYEGQYSPTVSLIGNNSTQEDFQKAWLSDIYIDKSPMRVILANEPKASELEHYELQRPKKWNGNEIRVSINLGELSTEDNLYLYVYGEDGEINPDGIPVCEFIKCPAAPRKVDLTVE